MKTESRKVFAIAVGLTMFAGISQANAQESQGPGDLNAVEIPVETLLAPSIGFEEKNDIQVVLHGALPNACYSLAGNSVERLGDGKIRVRQLAVRQNTGVCAEGASLPVHMTMLVPFTSEVSVGHLNAGDYEFEYLRDNGKEGFRKLNVAHNVTPGVDSLPYAAVSNETVPDVVRTGDDLLVTLTGVLNSSCTRLDPNVRVMDEKDVKILLPTVTVQKNVLCTQALIPFSKTVNLGKLAAGEYLIQTRSMHGRAVNRIVDVVKAE